MFRGEREASIEGADEEVYMVGGTWIGLDIPTEKQCGKKAVKKEELVSAVNVQWKL